MAETAKLLNPEKTVLIPDLEAGCSLAASITAADVRLMRAAPSGRADRHLRQHLGGGEGRVRHLLHLGQRQENRRGARRAARHHAPGRIPGPQHRGPDQGRDHRLEGPLRSARAFHRRGRPKPAREPSRHHRAGASRMPARGRRRMRFHRLDRGDGRLCRARTAGACRAADRMLDERQRRAAISRSRLCAAVQSVPAHEADHLAEHPPLARNDDPRGDRRSRRSPSGRAAPSSACWRSAETRRKAGDASAYRTDRARRVARGSGAGRRHHDRRDRAGRGARSKR